MAASPSNMASSMFTSITFAPDSTCCRATATASSNFSPRISRENFFEPVILVRSPIVRKLLSGRMIKRLEAAEASQRFDRRAFARRLVGHGGGDGADMGRRRAATAADHVQPAIGGKLAERAGHHAGRFVEFAECVRQAGIGIAAYEHRRDAATALRYKAAAFPAPTRN